MSLGLRSKGWEQEAEIYSPDVPSGLFYTSSLLVLSSPFPYQNVWVNPSHYLNSPWSFFFPFCPYIFHSLWWALTSLHFSYVLQRVCSLWWFPPLLITLFLLILTRSTLLTINLLQLHSSIVVLDAPWLCSVHLLFIFVYLEAHILSGVQCIPSLVTHTGL